MLFELFESFFAQLPLLRWCVTFADLEFFQAEVHRRWPTEPSQMAGPNIYEVNEQYIKPVTAAAGKMSWALMMNPAGLDCDLFITHAWREEVFEFTQKVLASWPFRANSAWCCMLANPQNLDIGLLLQSPSSSPFALALTSCKHMLVVPNRHSSVYTRLWCGYEAYLAFQSNKIIRTAAPPIWRAVLFSWLRMCPALLIGIRVLWIRCLCFTIRRQDPWDCHRTAAPLTPKTTPTDRHIWQSHGVSGDFPADKFPSGKDICIFPVP